MYVRKSTVLCMFEEIYNHFAFCMLNRHSKKCYSGVGTVFVTYLLVSFLCLIMAE